MGFFKFFGSRNEDSSAKLAKDRLQVLIAHERTGRDGPDYLPMLRQDLLDVIKKYVPIDDDALTVQLESQDNCDVLELNITLPETKVSGKGSARSAAQAAAHIPPRTSAQPSTQPSEEAKRRAALRRQNQAIS